MMMKMAVAKFDVMSQHLPRKTEKSHRKLLEDSHIWTKI